MHKELDISIKWKAISNYVAEVVSPDVNEERSKNDSPLLKTLHEQDKWKKGSDLLWTSF